MWADSKLTLATIVLVYGLVGSWEIEYITNRKYCNFTELLSLANKDSELKMSEFS